MRVLRWEDSPHTGAPLELRNLAHEPPSAALIDELNGVVGTLVAEELTPS